MGGRLGGGEGEVWEGLLKWVSADALAQGVKEKKTLGARYRGIVIGLRRGVHRNLPKSASNNLIANLCARRNLQRERRGKSGKCRHGGLLLIEAGVQPVSEPARSECRAAQSLRP